VEGSELSIVCTAAVHGELHDESITAQNGKLPWSTKSFVGTVHKIEYHDIVSSGIFADKFHYKRSRESTQDAIKTLLDAAKSYIIEVLAKSHFRSSNSCLVGFQHTSYYGNAGRSGTARTVQHAPCIEYLQNGQRRVFSCCNRENTTTNEITSWWSSRREEVKSWVSWA